MDKTLRILHVSDIHCCHENVQKLKDSIKQDLDVVLISGDVADVPLDQYHTASKDLLQEHHDILLRITADFVPLADKVYFIPGNHDTISHYAKSPLTSEKEEAFPVNVHSHKLKIAPDLYLLGLGGSVPAFRGGKEVLEGFPYSTDAKFGEDLSELLDPVLHEEGEGEGEETVRASYILMTHDGPNNSSTTEIRIPPDEPVVTCGSDILYQYLSKKTMQERTVLNVHGHVHPAIGMSSIGRVSVINPGSLREGNYGIYDLKRSADGQHTAWKMSRVSLCRL